MSGHSCWRVAWEVTAQARGGVCCSGSHLVHTHEHFWVETQLLSGHSNTHIALLYCCVGVREARSWSLLRLCLVQQGPFVFG